MSEQFDKEISIQDEYFKQIPTKEPIEEKPPLTNSYRDNLKITALRADVDAIKVDLTNFVGALLQSGVVELVKDEQGNVIYKINKVVLVDESVQQD
jgi:hypothetical protein